MFAQESNVINVLVKKIYTTLLYNRKGSIGSLFVLSKLVNQVVLKLVNKSCLRSSSSSSRSLNIFANEKFNQNSTLRSTLRLLLIKIYPYSLSTASRMRKVAKGETDSYTI